MSRNPILRIYVDSQCNPIHYLLLIPPFIEWEDNMLHIRPFKKGGVGVNFYTDQPLIYQVRPDDIDGHKDEALLEQFGLSPSWIDFWEGIDEISPPLIMVYPYHCGICHKEEVYAEDPELENFKPYHCHGHYNPPRSVLRTLARVYHLRRLAPRWVPNNTPMILYSQKREGHLE
jgi:hypothetical protein